jgi:glutamate N-acetyltransferase/amino-acid N-acetyltransferase
MTRRSGVTIPAGFMAAGLWCGVKKKGAGLDLALIVSDRPATASGVFTTNQVKGAPVLWNQKALRGGAARAIVVNSGNANVMTATADGDTARMAEAVGEFYGFPAGQTLVASTGVIGQPMPMEKILKGIGALAPTVSPRGGCDAARAIMTTDLVMKESSAKTAIGGKSVAVGGCAKGSGMIHPNMATMLAFITTDAAVTKAVAKELVKRAADRSFNRITVDGDTSTSDMLLFMANGAAGAPVIDTASGKRYEALLEAVSKVCVDLAKKVVRDGEGATKFVTVTVTGAAKEKDAEKVAKAIATSSLVKTALFGEDANWGRIFMAAGNAGVAFDPARLTLSIGGAPIFKNGGLVSPDWEKKVAPRLKKPEVDIHLDLGGGGGEAQVWTCDFSYDYVKINGDYRS